MSDKRRFPRAAALAVANELCACLKPCTTRLIVAGSLRRMKADVGDVEILYIPVVVAERTGLFASDTIQVNRADQALDNLVKAGVLSPRLNTRGSASWGHKNKLALHVASGIPVDLFSATEANWWNYLVCRTGPADSNTRIASLAQARGWQWNPYGPGFTRVNGMAEPVVVASEREVFEFVGLPYLEPKDRT